MAIEDDIEEFHQWAIKLGCPEKSIPNSEALKSIFKSRQHEIFRNLMKRVQPLQVVQEGRENITLNQAEKLKHQIIPVCQRSFLSKRMQTYLKWQDLTKTQKEEILQYEEHKSQYDKIASTIKALNVKRINLAQRKKTLQGLTTVLKIKLEQFDKQLLLEGENKQQILSSIPVKLMTMKNCENDASKVVEKALNELYKFYAKTEENNNADDHKSTLDDLWQKMRDILNHVSNYLLFKEVMRLKEEQLLHIMGLNEQHHHEIADEFNGSNAKKKLEISAFDMKLFNTKTEFLGLVGKYFHARTERIEREQQFSETYMDFVEELRAKVSLFHSDKESDDIDEQISDFLVQYNLRNMKRSQNDFLNHQIDELKIKISDAAKHLEHHELLLGDVKQMYVTINLSINRVQYEITQLGQIKDKILYSRNILKHMLNEKAVLVGAKQNLISNSNAMRMKDVTLGGGDSFELGGDNVFCSTKLDFDATLLNNTLCPVTTPSDFCQLPASGGRFILPPHMVELTTFLDRPMQHYSFMTDLCSFYIKPCPLITESRELNSIIQLVPGLLLSPYYALLEVQERFKLSQALDAVSQKLQLDVKWLSVDIHILKERRKAQHEQMAESLDKIERTIASLNHLLHKAQKIYDFILENPVGRFIPATKRYKNYTYTDYETEFLRYQHMVGASI